MMRKYILLIACFLCSFYTINTYASIGEEVSKIAQQQNPKVFYSNGILHLSGFTGKAKLEVFSILGSKVHEENNIDLSYSKQLSISLKNKSMYIVRIQTSEETKTFKFIAQ